MSGIVLGAFLVFALACVVATRRITRRVIAETGDTLVCSGCVAQPEQPGTDTPAPLVTDEQEYTFNLRRRVKKHLNYALATWLRSQRIQPTSNAWTQACKSPVVLFMGDRYMGDWSDLNEATVALMGLDVEAREDLLTCMRVILPASDAELAMLRSCLDLDDDQDEREQEAAISDLHAKMTRLAGTFTKIEPIIPRRESVTVTERNRERAS